MDVGAGMGLLEVSQHGRYVLGVGVNFKSNPSFTLSHLLGQVQTLVMGAMPVDGTTAANTVPLLT